MPRVAFTLESSAVKRAQTSISSPGGLVVLVGISTDQLSFNTADFVTNHLNSESPP